MSVATAGERCARPVAPPPRSRISRRLVAFLLAALACQSAWTSLAVVGWLQRCMRRSAQRAWHARRPAGLAVDPAPTESRWAAIRGCCREGIRASANTFLATAVPLGLFAYAWWAGWNNSFHKGYEQAEIGPLTALFAIFLFSQVMIVLPLAQARQAVANDWRAFYDWGLTWGLARRRAPLALMLSALYALLTLPLTAYHAAPAFVGTTETFRDATNEEIVQWLTGYALIATIVLVLPSVFFLRLLAARLYARALVVDLRRACVTGDELAAAERVALAGVVDLPSTRAVAGGRLRRAARACWSFGTAAGLSLGSLAIWFVVYSEVVIGQFLAYRPLSGWMNHALIHLPWVRHIPDHLG